MYAQKKETFKGELYIGAGGGPLFSKVDFVPAVPSGFKQGIFGGVSAKYISEKNLGIVVEVNYAQRGWEEEFDPASDFSYSRTLNYVEMPFMTHIYAGKKARFILNLGPQISLLVGHSQKMSQALADDLEARRAENPERSIGMQYEGIYPLKPIDYGLVGGIGMELKTGIGNFDLEGRYYFGLGDIFTNRRTEDAYFSRSASRVIEAKLTYYIKVF
ncbi:PorT family protein [Proteiniphilum sp. X52]|nr:PorT family protein [Proteiniphilum sp. X52]